MDLYIHSIFPLRNSLIVFDQVRLREKLKQQSNTLQFSLSMIVWPVGKNNQVNIRISSYIFYSFTVIIWNIVTFYNLLIHVYILHQHNYYYAIATSMTKERVSFTKIFTFIYYHWLLNSNNNVPNLKLFLVLCSLSNRFQVKQHYLQAISETRSTPNSRSQQ